MNNLIIIGNGFDLAHGMKTSYGDFMRYLVDDHCQERTKFSELFSLSVVIENYDQLKSVVGEANGFSQRYSNKIGALTKLLLEDLAINNWCDLEEKYFYALTLKNQSKNMWYDPFELNKEFEKLEYYLKQYLSIEEENAIPLKSYEKLFKRIDSKDTTILTFNYTRTIQKLYGHVINKSKIIYMHGELDNSRNPIVFGYAADDNEARSLLQSNSQRNIQANNEYMRHIKKHQYKRASNEHYLSRYLDGTKNIDVSILGHSCGLSDKLILNQIFNHENISSIRTFYYEEYEHYFQTQVNIDRIMNNDERFRKRLINFDISHRMPQKEDNETQENEFYKYISDIRTQQEEEIDRPRKNLAILASSLH